MKRVLVTGGCGFIGQHVVRRLTDEGCRVTVVDRVSRPFDGVVQVLEVDIRDRRALHAAVRGRLDAVVHLAAGTGVRESLSDATAYHDVNVLGTQSVLDLACDRGVEQFVFASSSSVYGTNPSLPWFEDSALHPISPYAASKIGGEVLGLVASRLYGMRFLALRLFSVYGPQQRRDLALHTFARAIDHGDEVRVFGSDAITRDFTYISDVIDAIWAATSYAGSAYEVINVGAGRRVSLKELIETLERLSGRRARIQRLPAVLGDVCHTHASIEKARTLLGYLPRVGFEEGVRRFDTWRRAGTRTAGGLTA